MTAAAAPLALEQCFPGLQGRLRRSVLTRLPTPVARLECLGRHVGHGELWIKRDDISSPLYGGNKPRKLELILGDAVAQGKRTVLTTGGIGTHHGLATAICAGSLGMRTILALLEQPVTEAVRHSLLLDFAVGAELHWASSVGRLAARAARLMAREALKGELPYLIPTGGTSTLGTIGYVNAGLELAQQVAAGQLPEPTYVFVPMGSGGTVAGLILGLKLGGLKSRVVAVVVTDILPPGRSRISRLAMSSSIYLHHQDERLPRVTVRPDDYDVIADQIGAGYGHPTAAGIEARDRMRDDEGIVLDTTYTAKCLAAILAGIQGGGFGRGPLLFWNTYSAVDPAERLGPLPDYHKLPHPFHRFFEGPAVAA